MSTGKWLWACLRRYVLTVGIGWVAAALVLPLLGDDPFWEALGAGLGVGLIVVPLLTAVTMLVLTLLAGRRFEPPTGGPSRIQGGWLIVLPLLLLLPVALLAPLQYLMVLGAQLVYLVWVLPCQDANDTADVLRSLTDPAVPAPERARMARAVAGLHGRPVLEALVQTSADAEPEVAEAGLETLCAIWRRDGVVGEDLLLKLEPQAQDRVRALGVTVRSPW
ncbi:hypothetical protein GCM10010371_31950 [Streptomyces subrutilus]|uniref:Uncharacterized protein n=1 Tax=Streptomyces subrutilus TaxID=36818 RepID=A0A5P2UXQ6_9ACTN|nr:hypothetical protein [Streptomyces subrutilus]QEU82301.1 hypothetical protein CP968_32140 [Streptomyces subrutilus]GGZ69716.1 hypothetical protein GCM10010371_31950 [Streptomyces subrutilus]